MHGVVGCCAAAAPAACLLRTPRPRACLSMTALACSRLGASLLPRDRDFAVCRAAGRTRTQTHPFPMMTPPEADPREAFLVVQKLVLASKKPFFCFGRQTHFVDIL